MTLTILFIVGMYYYNLNQNHSTLPIEALHEAPQRNEPSRDWPPKFAKNLIDDKQESAQPPSFGIDNETNNVAKEEVEEDKSEEDRFIDEGGDSNNAGEDKIEDTSSPKQGGIHVAFMTTFL